MLEVGRTKLGIEEEGKRMVGRGRGMKGERKRKGRRKEGERDESRERKEDIT
jgi:hypothetical protein